MSSTIPKQIQSILSDLTKRRAIFLLIGSFLSGILLLQLVIPSFSQTSYNISTSYAESPSLKAESYSKTIHSETLVDFTKYTYQVKTNSNLGSNEEPSILLLSTIANYKSYGGVTREFKDFIVTITSLIQHQERPYQVSLGVLCNDPSEFKQIVRYIESHSVLLSKSFKRITLISAPFLHYSPDQGTSSNIQNRLLARSKNFLISNALDLEQYTIFIDPGIVAFEEPQSIISTFIKSNKDIVVPRIQQGNDVDFDKNSWRGKRSKPTKEQLFQMDENKWDTWDYTPREDNTYRFKNYMNNDNEERESHKKEIAYSVSLDSVGSLVLFVKSMVFKQGAIFPTSNIIGTTWDRLEGYDGIETLGICYIAKPLGYKCWGMPNIVAHYIS